ncbi:MAG: hypothetical protein MZW92_48785 [Comamonadaceae bacterium]|nr:hypothetical protein [Comamonadaceae bacterium]
MKAIRIHAYGGPEQMQLDDAPVPACGASDLLVRVVAAGVNPIDWKIRCRGDGARTCPRASADHARLGCGRRGRCASAARSPAFKPGDEVCFYAEFARGGTYAEYVAVDASQVAMKPRTARLCRCGGTAHGRPGGVDRARRQRAESNAACAC